MPGCQFAVTHEVRPERAGGGARGGVFVNLPGEHASRENFAVASRCEAVGHGGIFSEQLAKLKHIHADFSEPCAIPERHHEIEDASRNALGIEMRIEIFRGQAQRFGQSRFFKLDGTECGFRLRHGDSLWAAILETNFDGKDAGTRFLHHVYPAFLCRNDAQFGEKKPRANDRVAGKFQLFARSEDAQAGQCTFIGRFLNEDRFGEIHFARDGLHLIVRKAVAVSEDRERIALESRGGENVESVKTVFHWILSRGRSGFGNQICSSWTTVLSLVMFPVLRVDFGSIKTMCTSSSATGQCSRPRGTMTNSPSPTTASRSRNFMRNVPLTTRNNSSSLS